MILDAWGWCTGMTQRDGMGREVGGGFRMGNTTWDTRLQSLGQEDPLEKGLETHSSILTWRNPWTEEPGVGRREERTSRKKEQYVPHVT